MNKHTPGPWRLDGPHVVGDNEHSAKVRVAKVAYTNTNVGKANARLIAAAPDLLEAARWAATQLGYKHRTNHNTEYCDGIDALRAAIARAEDSDV